MSRGKLVILQICSMIPLLLPTTVLSAELPPSLLISEIQTASVASASEEFIELANVTEDDIDVTGWRVEYFSAGSATLDTPSRTVPLTGIVASGKQLLLASTDYLVDEANVHFSATLAKAGGHVRLVSPDMVNIGQYVARDLVGWGTALHPEAVAAVPPSEGVSLQRKVDEQAKLIDTDNNEQDFALNTVPTPQGDAQPTPPPDPDPDPDPDLEPDPNVDPDPDPNPTPDDDTEVPAAYLPLKLSELLPNPASPQTDAEHEYVELFNPNNEAVDLEGYKLQTGNSLSYSFEFGDETIGAGQYRAFFVTQTDTLLANTSGKARLSDPDGTILDETSYGAADEGVAWAFIGGAWQWTISPTPDAPNTLTVEPPVVKVSKAKTAKAKTTKTAKAKTASAKVASAKTTGAARDVYEAPPTVTVQPLHPAVLAVVGGLTVAYAAYEYRQDMANAVYKFRRNREVRRASRK